MKTIVFLGALLWVGAAGAVEAVCKVKGMHCKGCVEMVEGKICDEKEFSSCQVRIVDEKKQMGEIRLASKDPKANINVDVLDEAIRKAGYTLEKCSVSSNLKIPAAEPKTKPAATPKKSG